jgi:hypothetical protein
MNRNTRIALLALAAVVLVFAGGSLALHFGQKAHNHMDYSIEAAFPEGQATVPGEIIGRTLVEVMSHELDSPFGWRPNDLFLWGPGLWADNNSNRQIGIIQAVRETTRVFRDNLTKLTSDEFDSNLRLAETMFRNDPEKFMLPSAEKQFSQGVRALKKYVKGLHSTPETSRPLNLRNVELIKLFEAWAGLLGDAHANLYRTENPDGSPVTSWQTDNYFYEAQGNAAVMYWIMQALAREYVDGLPPSVMKLFQEVEDALESAAMLKPVIVLDGSPEGLTANSRGNLDGFVFEARDKMVSIIEELKKK